MAIYTVNPYGPNAQPAVEYNGEIFASYHSTPTTTLVQRIRIQGWRSNWKYDDVVAHVPSIDFTSSGASLPAVGDTIKFTNQGGTVTAIVSGVKGDGQNQSNQAIGTLTLRHMEYTPSGGALTRYDGMTWGGTGCVGVRRGCQHDSERFQRDHWHRHLQLQA